MSFISELERLKEKATKGPWRDDCGYRAYGPKEDHVMCKDYEPLLFETKHTDATGADSTFIVFIRNHADEIAELVKAAEWVDKRFYRADRDVIVINDLHAALAALSKEKP